MSKPRRCVYKVDGCVIRGKHTVCSEVDLPACVHGTPGCTKGSKPKHTCNSPLVAQVVTSK